jgi:hypothetical protein
MHPGMTHLLTDGIVAERLAASERERQVRSAGKHRPYTIDAVAIGGRLRRTLQRVGQGVRSAKVGAGA